MIAKLIEALFKDRDGYVGRKLAAAWSLTVLVSLLLFIHIPISLINSEPVSPILESGDFSTILSIIWATYFAANSANSWLYHTSKKNKEEE